MSSIPTPGPCSLTTSTTAAISSLRRVSRWACQRSRRPSGAAWVDLPLLMPLEYLILQVTVTSHTGLWGDGMRRVTRPVAALRERGQALSAPQKLATAAAGASAAVLGATALEVRRRLAAHDFGPGTDLVRGVVARMTTPLLPD